MQIDTTAGFCCLDDFCKTYEKWERAGRIGLLASWASDARAVPDQPGLRRLDDGRILELDDILEALKQLGEFPSSTRSTKQSHRSYRHRRWATLSRIFRRGDNDDDDPTSPAPIAPRPRPQVFYDTRQLAAA